MKVFYLDSMLEFCLSEIKRTAENSMAESNQVEKRYIGSIVHSSDYASTFEIGFENPYSHTKFIEAVEKCEPIKRAGGEFPYWLFPSRSLEIQSLTHDIIYILREQMEIPNFIKPTLYVLANLSDLQINYTETGETNN